MTLEVASVGLAGSALWADGRDWSEELRGLSVCNGLPPSVDTGVTGTGSVGAAGDAGAGKTAAAVVGKTGGDTYAGETGTVGICETGAGGIGLVELRDCADAVGDCVGMLRNECAAAELA